MSLTKLEVEVVNRLREKAESDPDAAGFAVVYLDNCRFTKRELGALGSLEQKGYYKPEHDPHYAGFFGNVLIPASLDRDPDWQDGYNAGYERRRYDSENSDNWIAGFRDGSQQRTVDDAAQDGACNPRASVGACPGLTPEDAEIHYKRGTRRTIIIAKMIEMERAECFTAYAAIIDSPSTECSDFSGPFAQTSYNIDRARSILI